MTSKDTTIASLNLTPESHRVLEASIAAGTSGAGLRLLVMIITAATAVALVIAIAIAATCAVAGMSGDVGQMQMAAFALAFAAPFAISLLFEVRFLRRLQTG